MIKVALHQVKFFAYHGFYPEEQILGNHFLVDVEVEFNNDNAADDDLSNTVNYEKLYSIISEEMKKPRKLLETLAQEMISKICSAFPYINAAKIGIKKLNPPLPGEVKYSLIEITWIKEA